MVQWDSSIHSSNVALHLAQAQGSKGGFFFLWLVIHKAVDVNGWSGWSSAEINKSCPHCHVVCNLWSQWNTCSSFVYWPNMCGGQWRKHTKLCGTLCLTMVDLSGNGLLWNWEKTTNVAYQMFSTNLIWFGVSKVILLLVATLVVTWSIRPQIGIISWGPIGLGLFHEVVVLFPFNWICFQIVLNTHTHTHTHTCKVNWCYLGHCSYSPTSTD
jgi:hypothetical protein